MPAGSMSGSDMNGTDPDKLSKTNLYIRGLTPNTTDKDLVNLCQQYGKIISTKAIIDPKINKCKGYGFVDFETSNGAETAMKNLQSQGVQAQMAKQQEQDPTNLYIANLPPYMTENDLERIFNPFGKVISTRILRDPNGQSRGVGFARMENRDKCDQIINAYHGKCLPGLVGWKEALTVKFADSGQKKKNSKPWVDREDPDFAVQQSVMAAFNYEQAQAAAASGMAPNGVAPTVMTPPGAAAMMQRYTMSTTPVTSYQLPAAASWIYGQQFLPHMASVLPHGAQQGLDQATSTFLPSIAAQMQQLQLSQQSYLAPASAAGAYTSLAYPQQGTPIMPALALEEHMGDEYHFPTYSVQGLQK
jgi:hypothetical protein